MSSGVHKFKSSEELYTVYTVVDNGVFSVNLPSSKIFSLPSLRAGKRQIVKYTIDIDHTEKSLVTKRTLVRSYYVNYGWDLQTRSLSS